MATSQLINKPPSHQASYQSQTSSSSRRTMKEMERMYMEWPEGSEDSTGHVSLLVKTLDDLSKLESDESGSSN